MEETSKGGRGPPWVVAPLEREREREKVLAKNGTCYTQAVYVFVEITNKTSE
jgi:hypothetical protein